MFVIEREQVVRSALHYILRERHRTRAFASLDEVSANAPETPDVVLLGMSVLQDRNDLLPASLAGQFGNAAILLVAGSNSDQLGQQCLEHGASGIVRKPISFDTVCEAVERALGAPISRDASSRLVHAASD
ncbi:hypothetical protein [Bradyrhizobium sp. BR 10289]|uniref:hypothetical protein n=1 Tax=Bradyrhizobium sp. BR 10289 TaxID=2749993 RepID=UPI001C647B9E|nr:hypothetical protein [Bradyrhizobium sp. BR 10289]MBW7973655.1 hypothetical protein [Bradyrhizobium sp. BR 10289]